MSRAMPIAPSVNSLRCGWPIADQIYTDRDEKFSRAVPLSPLCGERAGVRGESYARFAPHPDPLPAKRGEGTVTTRYGCSVARLLSVAAGAIERTYATRPSASAAVGL